MAKSPDLARNPDEQISQLVKELGIDPDQEITVNLIPMPADQAPTLNSASVPSASSGPTDEIDMGSIALAPLDFLLSPHAWISAAARALPTSVAIYVAALVVLETFNVIYNSNSIISPNSGGVTHLLTNKNGWNWIEKGRKVSDKTFQIYSNSLFETVRPGKITLD